MIVTTLKHAFVLDVCSFARSPLFDRYDTFTCLPHQHAHFCRGLMVGGWLWMVRLWLCLCSPFLLTASLLLFLVSRFLFAHRLHSSDLPLLGPHSTAFTFLLRCLCSHGCFSNLATITAPCVSSFFYVGGSFNCLHIILSYSSFPLKFFSYNSHGWFFGHKIVTFYIYPLSSSLSSRLLHRIINLHHFNAMCFYILS